MRQTELRALRDQTAEVSFADIFERTRLGMAIAAMIRMIATTISSSMSEKPFCAFCISSPRRLRRDHWRLGSGGRVSGLILRGSRAFCAFEFSDLRTREA